MKLLLIQKDINDNDYNSLLHRAAQKSPDLVCLGELAVSGCLYRVRPCEPFENIARILFQFDFPVMIGLPRRNESGLVNSYIYYDAGQYQIYDKINLFPPMNETEVYQAGKKPGLFDTRLGKIGVAICYDLRFPEVFSKLKELSAAIIIVAAAWPLVRITDWKNLIIKRAMDNNIVIAGINAVGDDGINIFGGSSMVVGADGSLLAQADETSETTVEVEI